MSDGAEDLVFGDNPSTASFVTSALSELAQKGAQAYDQSQAQKAQKAQSAVDIQKGIAADAALAHAYFELAIASSLKDTTKLAAAQALVDVAEPDARSAPISDQRTQACSAALKKAAADANKSGADPTTTMAMVNAWKKVCALNAAPLPGGLPAISHEEGSFLTRKHAGIPTWGWGVGGLGVVGLIYGAFRLFRGRSR
jgi:hypothetical protein